MEYTQQILALAEKYRDETVANLSQLVRIKSLSRQEEQVQIELKRQMEAAGFDEVKVDGLGNVIGRIGNGTRILAIDGHIDTVEVGNRDNWDFDPFAGTEENGYLLGRGSVDQKGGVAAFVTAGKILKTMGFDRDWTVYFVGSVMEEDCDGLCWKYIVEESGIRPDIVISTEPTSCKIHRGQRGRMEMEVAFKGISSHGSAPERGQNAIYMAAEACLDIQALNNRLPTDEFLGKGSATITAFESDSPSLCAVADYAKIHIDRRLTWEETKASAVTQIEAIIANRPATVTVLDYHERAYTGMTYGMEKYFPTWKIPADHPAVATGVSVYKGLFNQPPQVDKWTFSTNAVTITGLYGIPTIGFGPGDEVQAHAPNEKVPINDLVTASTFYAGYACQVSL